MKIGIVCYPTYGGSGVVATELGKVLAFEGHEVHFITYNMPQRLDAFHENIYYHEVNPASYPLFKHLPYESALSSTIVSVAQHQNLDVLHAHYAVPHASAAYMAKQILLTKGKYLPVVTTLHGTDITLVGKDSSYAPVVTFSINQSNAVTVVSKSLKQDTLAHFPIDKELDVIPNFVDPNKFRKVEKSHFKRAICPEGEKLIVHISNFRKVKRTADVLESFKGILDQMPAKLLMVGDGPDRHKLEERCRELGTCNDIRFLGKLDAVEEVLSIADLFVMPSEKESFGLAALEAMACEVPVLGSNAGGLPELVTSEAGRLADVGDIEGLTQKGLEILDPKNHKKFSEGALKRAMEFTPSAVVPLYEDVYHRVVEAGKKEKAIVLEP